MGARARMRTDCRDDDHEQQPQNPGNRRKTLGRPRLGARPDAAGGQVRQARRALRERALPCHLGGGALGGDRRPRDPRGQARQVELCPPAGDPAAVRLAADRKNQVAPQRRGQAGQAQRRDGADQRLRRRARGRADLQADRAVRWRRQGAGQAGAAAVVAVDDAAGHPRRLWRLAQRRADAPAGRRRAQPLRGRLAGGHQRHPRPDRLQQPRRRFFPHHRGPGADADAGGGGRARRKNPRLQEPRLLGAARQL